MKYSIFACSRLWDYQTHSRDAAKEELVMVLRRGEQFAQHPNEWSDNSWSEVIQKDPSGAAGKYETASMLPLHGIVGAFPITKNTSVFCSQRDTAKTQSVHLVSLPRPLSFPMAIPKLIGVKNAYSCGPLFPKTWEASQRMLLYHRISIQNYTLQRRG